MEQRWNQVNLAEIVLVRLSWKPEQEIPGYRDMIVSAPLEADDILHRRHALIHRPQLIDAQALQSRLHALYSPGRKRSNLVFMQVALGFDEYIEITVIRSLSTVDAHHVFHLYYI